MPERQVSGKKRDREGVLVTEIPSQVDATYNSSDRLILNDTQEAVRLASMADQGDDDNGHIVDSDEHKDYPAEKMAWDSHDLQDSSRRDTTSLQAIRDLVLNTTLRNHLTLLVLRPFLITGSLLFVELSSSWFSSPRHRKIS